MFTGSSVYDRRPDTEQCCFAVAWKGASWTDPDSIPLMVMQTMLGARLGERGPGQGRGGALQLGA
jgi:processing peptidase subunit beta